MWALALLSSYIGVFVNHRRASLVIVSRSDVDELVDSASLPTNTLSNGTILMHNATQQRKIKKGGTFGVAHDLGRMRRQGRKRRQLLAPDWYQNTTQRLVVHLHIGKNGGTSMDRIGPFLARQVKYRYVGRAHFDWSFIDTLPQNKTNVITMLRHPVKRAVSHFYFSKTLKWTRNGNIRNMTLEEYLNDPSEMIKSRTLWADGQAATWWLTGTHAEPWVNVNRSEVREREQMHKNAMAMCLLAADRLDQTLWFGILEDLPRSMELLQHTLGLPTTPSFPKANAMRQVTPELTEWEQKALSSLMPQDLWIYEYGQRLFEARYHGLKTGEFVPPERPPIPVHLTCTSTNSRLDCTEGPLKGSFEQKDMQNEQQRGR